MHTTNSSTQNTSGVHQVVRATMDSRQTILSSSYTISSPTTHCNASRDYSTGLVDSQVVSGEVLLVRFCLTNSVPVQLVVVRQGIVTPPHTLCSHSLSVHRVGCTRRGCHSRTHLSFSDLLLLWIGTRNLDSSFLIRLSNLHSNSTQVRPHHKVPRSFHTHYFEESIFGDLYTITIPNPLYRINHH